MTDGFSAQSALKSFWTGILIRQKENESVIFVLINNICFHPRTRYPLAV